MAVPWDVKPVSGVKHLTRLAFELKNRPIKAQAVRRCLKSGSYRSRR